MNNDALFARLRQEVNDDLLRRLRTLTQVEEPTQDQWHELVELFDALDANLCGGGVLPTVWSADYIRAQLRKIAEQVTREVMGEAIQRRHADTPDT